MQWRQLRSTQAILLALSIAACSSGKPSKPQMHAHGDQPVEAHSAFAAAALPLLITVPGGVTTTGFAIGKLRKSDYVDGFRIMKYPVTQSDYELCVREGACSEPATQSCTAHQKETLGRADVSSPKAPALCVSASDAKTYCQRLGGRLPNLNEWLFASRGSSVTRYAWGNTQPSCDQHLAGASRGSAGSGACTTAASTTLEVGQHPAGASPQGVEDVLLAPGELIGADPHALVPACSQKGGACVAYGLAPGAIDFVTGVGDAKSASVGLGPDPAYAFRCLLNGAEGT